MNINWIHSRSSVLMERELLHKTNWIKGIKYVNDEKKICSKRVLGGKGALPNEREKMAKVLMIKWILPGYFSASIGGHSNQSKHFFLPFNATSLFLAIHFFPPILITESHLCQKQKEEKNRNHYYSFVPFSHNYPLIKINRPSTPYS